MITLLKVNSKFCENDKNHLEFNLEIYKEQQNGKVYHLFLTQNSYIRLKDLYRKLLKEENFLNKHKHLQACCQMDDPNVLGYSLKFLSRYNQLEYWNQDIFLRGRLCQICELPHRPLKDATR